MSRLVEVLAKGTAYDAISGALAAKDRRLKEARAELAALSTPATPSSAVPTLSAGGVTAWLGRLWDDIRKLDGDRARVALGQIFNGIVVEPLGGPGRTAGP